MTNPFAKKLGLPASGDKPKEPEAPKPEAFAAAPAAKSALAARFTKPKAPEPTPKVEQSFDSFKDVGIIDDPEPDQLNSLPVKKAEPKPKLELSDLDSLEDEGETPSAFGGLSQFDDETPATKPTRELPEGIDKAQLQFVDLIDGVYDIIHDPELLGNVIRSIMIELKSYKHYMDLVCDDDVHMWVRAMRNTMGLSRIKKEQAKTTRGKSKTSKAVDADMLEAFNDLGIDVNDL